MKRTRTLVAIIALGAIGLSATEGLGSSACMTGDMSAAGDPAAMAHGSHDMPAPADAHEDGPRCPLDMATMSGCGIATILPPEAPAAPTTTLIATTRIPALFIVPASGVGLDLFHPPRA